MDMSDQLIHGNLTQKYNTKNVLHKLLMNNFIRNFHHLLDTHVGKDIGTICEIGCAEGELLKIVREKFPSAELHACDLSPEEINKAQKNCEGLNVHFSIQDAQNLSAYHTSQFDLVICCEVLEHLPKPVSGLIELERITSQHILISVPNEPTWSILNLMRGKYIQDLGNTPGHLNHWNKKRFKQFLNQAKNLRIISTKYPFPWQMNFLIKEVRENKNTYWNTSLTGRT
jgi:2-polyprenyl-3-methyl-5-hydroxy-6-metoxy-1,4-benzoquinol methylase